MKKNKLVAFCLAVVFSNSAFALDLSLNTAVDKIMAESNDLKSADNNVKKAEAALDAVNSNRWFKIDGSANYMNLVNVEKPFGGTGVELPVELGGLISSSTGGSISDIQIPDNIFMAGVDITQPIYTFGKIGNAVDAVRSAIKISKYGREISKREIKYAAVNLYWTAKMTDDLVNILQQSLDNTISAKKKLTNAGRANRSNLVNIQVDIAKKKVNLSDAKFNRDTAYRMLKIMADINVDETLNLTDNFPEKFIEISDDIITNNPHWKMLEQQAKMYDKKARAARAKHYPTLAAVGSYSYMAANTDKNVWGGTKSQYSYWGLALQVPIFDGGLSRANATMQVMDAEIVRQDLDQSKKIKTEEYNTAIRRYKHLKTELVNLKNARNLAQKSYKITQNRFAAGQTSAIELSEVSSVLSQMDMALLNAKYNILMSAQTVKKLGE